jgi:hypothetical protein
VDLATCPLCQGLGFVVPDLPFGHPDFGKAVSCQCRAEERRQRRMRALQELSSLGVLGRLTFGTFIPEPSHLARDRAINLHRAFDTCVAYAQEPEGWLLLTGAYGCGKTHMAAAIANFRVAEGYPTCSITCVRHSAPPVRLPTTTCLSSSATRLFSSWMTWVRSQARPGRRKSCSS